MAVRFRPMDSYAAAKAVFADRQIWKIVLQSRIGTNTILILTQMEVFIVCVKLRPSGKQFSQRPLYRLGLSMYEINVHS